MLKVIQQCDWSPWSGLNNADGLVGKLTHCESNGVQFFVRENTKYDSFALNAGARIAMKQGRGPRGLAVLELCAADGAWDELAATITALDPMSRPVRRNRLFTKAWALDQFKRQEVSA